MIVGVSTDRIRKTTEGLCKHVNRIAGTRTEREAADYLKGVLTDIGYDVTEHVFPVVAWEPIESSMRLLGRGEKQVDCAMFPNSPGVEGEVELVELESGMQASAGEMPLYGLADWGDNLYASPSIPYNRALDLGLDGLLICSPDKGELLKVRVGDQGRELEIPVLSISKESGDMLRELMKESEAILDITCVAKRDSSESRNLEAVLEGNDPDFDIVISAHYDAWFSGGADNAAPVAGVIELARQLKEHVRNGGKLRRTVRFLLYGAEESGSERYYFWLNGSKNYVESQDSLDRFALVVNIDSIGYDATNYVASTFELLKFAQSMAAATGNEKRFSFHSPPADGSDHWFFTIAGVPTVYLISWPSHLYHTQRDVPDALDFESISEFAEYALKAVTEFCTTKVLSLDVMGLIEFMEERFEGYKKVEGSPFELQQVCEESSRILSFRDALAGLVQETEASGRKEDIAMLNAFLLKTARVLNRTIGKMGSAHEANYLARLALV
ncbi:Zn-dependent exopeptidase M28, partial [Candidatus Thorarchaeota archaeon]